MIKFEWDKAKLPPICASMAFPLRRRSPCFTMNSPSSFLMLGVSDEARLLLVCHCERDHGNMIRIISARKATKYESKYYSGGQR